MTAIVVASANQDKIKEICSLLAPLGLHPRSMADVLGRSPELLEDGDTFIKNAFSKARQLSQLTPSAWCLADDSGLVVDALDGAPGVRSARYSRSVAQGRVRDLANNEKLLRELKRVPPALRRARFVCSLVLLGPEGQRLDSTGRCEGRILDAMRGEGGFGYDPLFFVDKFQCSMAELDMKQKNSISHRGQALRELLEKMYSRRAWFTTV
jgi:XTP/dITP diphosphohydrolase